MTEQAKVEFVRLDDAPTEHLPVFEAIGGFDYWNSWEPSVALAVDMPEHITVKAVKAAGKWLGQRVMLVRDRADHRGERMAVFCQRGRWAAWSDIEIKVRTGELIPKVRDDEPGVEADPWAELHSAADQDGEVTVSGPLLHRLLLAHELAEKDLHYKRQEIEGLKRSCDATRLELRAVREGEAVLERRVRAAEARVAKVERAIGSAVVATLIERGLLAELEATREELRQALTVLDDVAPRPWYADLDNPHDEQDDGNYDHERWVVTDNNDCELDSSEGENEPSNGVWAREYVEFVNGLGSRLEPAAPTSGGPKE